MSPIAIKIRSRFPRLWREEVRHARADPEECRLAEDGGGAKDRSRGSRSAKVSALDFQTRLHEAVFIYARLFAIVAVTKLREHWDETNSKVMQRKTQLDMMLGDSKEYEAKRNAVEVWLSRMETRLERMRAVGHTADVLAMQLEEQKVRRSSSLPRCSCDNRVWPFGLFSAAREKSVPLRGIKARQKAATRLISSIIRIALSDLRPLAALIASSVAGTRTVASIKLRLAGCVDRNDEMERVNRRVEAEIHPRSWISVASRLKKTRSFGPRRLSGVLAFFHFRYNDAAYFAASSSRIRGTDIERVRRRLESS